MARDSRVKAVVDDGSTKRFVNVLEAEVNRFFTRAADKGYFEFTAKDKVKQNDRVDLIADVANTRFLTAIYNFQNNVRDESGNDIDVTPFTAGGSNADFVKDTTPRYTRNVPTVIRFDNTNEEITIPHNSEIDFSKNFDIYLHIRPITNSTARRVIWSKSDGGSSVGGIKIGYSSRASSTDDLLAEIEFSDSNGNVNTITGSTNLDDGEYHVIRIFRDIEDNNIFLDIDGTQDGFLLDKTADFTGGTLDMKLGADNDSNFDAFTHVAQFRIYSGGRLQGGRSVGDSDADQVVKQKRQALTMKFSGIVQSINDKEDYKEVNCESFGRKLNLINLNKLSLDGRDQSGSNQGIDNVFFNMTMHDITKQIFSNIDDLTDWLYVNEQDGQSVSSTSTARYVAVGPLINRMEELFTIDNKTFWVHPRKVVIREDLDQSTDIVYNDKKYEMTDDGKDDSKTINDLTLLGEKQIQRLEENFTGDGSTTEFNLTLDPVGGVRVTDAGIEFERKRDASDMSDGDDYYIEYTQGASEGSRLIFHTAPGSNESIVINYDAETLAGMFVRAEDNTSINNIGRYAGKIIVPGISWDVTAILASNLNDRRDVINRRINIIVPFIVNSVRENMEITAKMPKKNINSLFTIKQITYFYPTGKTRLDVGEFMFDYLDVEIQENKLSNDASETIKRTTWR